MNNDGGVYVYMLKSWPIAVQSTQECWRKRVDRQAGPICVSYIDFGPLLN